MREEDSFQSHFDQMKFGIRDESIFETKINFLDRDFVRAEGKFPRWFCKKLAENESFFNIDDRREEKEKIQAEKFTC